MIVVQLAASPFVGGPERQMLGLAASLPAGYQPVFVAFADHGSSWTLLKEAQRQGFPTHMLEHDAPHYRAVTGELAALLRQLRADVLCCNGYKPDILGWRAARKAGVPVVSVSHGWTAATWKVRLNEALDRLVLRWMDRVVCVSEAQAVKVRRAGVPADRVVVIRNAIRPEPFERADPADRATLHGLFPPGVTRIVGAAGRLSPEKGFVQLVEAAALIARTDPGVGFVLFGEGPLRESLTRRIADLGHQERFILAGFRADLDRLLPHLDVAVLPSFTEGLPVVATAVGGTPEVVEEGVNGYLVPPGEPAALAGRLLDVLRDEDRRRLMGANGRKRVRDHFTFEGQSAAYQQLFQELAGSGRRQRDKGDAESRGRSGLAPIRSA